MSASNRATSAIDVGRAVSDTGSVDRDPTAGLEIYRVGGTVRDELMGRQSKDADYVVVGASPEEMKRRGFRPVGRDFPVFLHPETAEEYALARTERKSGHGYHGFVFHTGPDVTLEDDLVRRDLTINAMARSADDELIDPYHGRRDLENRTLRHVSPAFREDPVRILRLARFAARFADFRIAGQSLALCREMVAEGEVDHLVPERVWQEMSRALMEERPSRFFEVLREVGALAVILPEVDRLFGVPQVEKHHPEIDTGLHTLMVLDQSAGLRAPLESRFACLVHDLGKGLTPNDQWPRHVGHEKTGLAPIREVCERLRVPGNCREMGLMVGEFHLHAHRALELKPSTLARLFERLDLYRRTERLEPFLLACEADMRGRSGREQMPYPQGDYLRDCFRAASEVTARPFVEQGLKGPEIADAMHRSRVEAIRRMDA